MTMTELMPSRLLVFGYIRNLQLLLNNEMISREIHDKCWDYYFGGNFGMNGYKFISIQHFESRYQKFTIYHMDKLRRKAWDKSIQKEVGWIELDLSHCHQNNLSKQFETLFELNHPNMLSITNYTVDRKTNKCYFITDSIYQYKLDEYIKKGTVRLKKLKMICKQYLSVLSYLHSNNVCYQSNKIYIRNDYKLLLLDQFELFYNYIMPKTTTDRNILSDIRIFGITTLELMTSKKMEKESIPNIVSQIENDEIKSFIDLCIRSNTRSPPNCMQLLNHPFICMIDVINDNKLCLDLVATKNKVSIIKITKNIDDTNNVKISLCIKRAMAMKKDINVEFDYIFNKDTPLSVAKEMVNDLGLNIIFITEIEKAIKTALQ